MAETTSIPDSNGTPQRLALTRTEAAKAIGVSPRLIDSLIADRTSGFPIARISGRVVVPIRPLEEWLAKMVNVNRSHGGRR